MTKEPEPEPVPFFFVFVFFEGMIKLGEEEEDGEIVVCGQHGEERSGE